ncbi:MAG: efflux RND transporter periplasmic adaptor subunit [Thermodesulfobacteriota bacterium]|nr:MAG: efflux RND transporter periplasmic adaptor subunit [Thermodesulfobacteriota bacterium]
MNRAGKPAAKSIRTLLILLFFSLSSMLTAGGAHAASVGKAAPSGLPVIVAPVQKTDFADMVEALGTTRANETVTITAVVAGPVTEIKFEDGGRVSKGDVLLTLEKSEEEANLKAARALLEERTASYRRAQGLEKQQALSTATLKERQALLRQIEGEIEAIQSRINDRIIRAPFDGILGLRNVSPGALVRPGDAITTLDDLSRIKVDFDVPSVFLNDIRQGLRVEGRVEAFGDNVFRGEVSTVGTQVDPVTRTVRVRAILPNPDGVLRPGLLMSIVLFKNPRQALLVPEKALIQRESKFFVFAEASKDGKPIAVQKQVTIGSRVPGRVEITSGLKEGERVIVHGLMQVRNGQEISVRAVDEGGQSLDELLKQRKP